MYMVNNKPVIKDLRVIIPAGCSSRESKAMATVKSSCWPGVQGEEGWNGLC